MTDTYLDLANRREVYLSRFASYLRNEYTEKNLDEVYKQVRLMLLDAEEILSRTQLNELTKAIELAVASTTNTSWLTVTEQLDEMATQEATYYAKMFNETNSASLVAPAGEAVITKVASSALDLEGKKGVWAKFTAENTDSVTKSITEQIKLGYGNDESIGQMNKRIKKVTGGLLKRQSEALIRTGVAHYAQYARQALGEANSDIVEREIAVITFDNRVSDTCISISARYPEGWEFGKSPIGYPPYHFGCRTFISLMQKGQRELDGTRAAIQGQKGEEAEELFEGKKSRLRTKSQVTYSGRKDSDIFKAGQIKADTPMSKFLSTQPDWFVYDTLGKKRGQAFLDGKLDLAKLTDKDLKPLSLKKLGLL